MISQQEQHDYTDNILERKRMFIRADGNITANWWAQLPLFIMAIG